MPTESVPILSPTKPLNNFKTGYQLHLGWESINDAAVHGNSCISLFKSRESLLDKEASGELLGVVQTPKGYHPVITLITEEEEYEDPCYY